MPRVRLPVESNLTCVGGDGDDLVRAVSAVAAGAVTGTLARGAVAGRHGDV